MITSMTAAALPISSASISGHLTAGVGKLGSGRVFVWVEDRDDTIDFGLEALSTADSSRGGSGSHTDFNERCVMGDQT